MEELEEEEEVVGRGQYSIPPLGIPYNHRCPLLFKEGKLSIANDWLYVLLKSGERQRGKIVKLDSSDVHIFERSHITNWSVSPCHRNQRERNRVKTVNGGYECLRLHVPTAARSKKMSKVAILKLVLVLSRNCKTRNPKI